MTMLDEAMVRLRAHVTGETVEAYYEKRKPVALWDEDILIVLNALDKYREQVARLEQPEPQGDCLAICTGCGGTRTYFDKQNIERCLGCRSEASISMS